MKELSIEQKAKRYDEVVNEIKNLRDNLLNVGVINENGVIYDNFNRIFPELNETDDEKIRKALIHFISEQDGFLTAINGISVKDIITWLEKKGEQKQEWGEEDECCINQLIIFCENCMVQDNNAKKCANWLKPIKDRIQSKTRKKNIEQNLAKKYGITGIDSKHAEGKLGEMIKKKIETENVDNTNMVESKFKDGDWIVYKDAVWKVCNIALQDSYELLKINNEVSTRLIKDVDKEAHLWTINDAKPGDIIYAESKFNTFDFIGVFYTTLENGNFWCYCDVSSDSDIYNDYLECWEFDSDKSFVALDRYNFYPATKKQRHLLYQKMKDAGYEWNAEKKELKDI